ncbi:response regulator [Azospirillum halopraeferens]|uniref:response regulator n=1 Tax=Azospirillum halopraeferens TaxID=34010 RepID=UPI000403A05E|nr:response regulator [Azospirillum halopraeferens]
MTAAAESRLPIRECHILVVDDTDYNRTLIGAMLNEAGFHDLAFAANGPEALERIAARTPDLVLLDLMMPGMDGFELCRRLRADHAYADLPVLVQTALSGNDDRNRAFAAGTTDLVSKPLDRTELIARVRIHLENRVLIRDLQTYRARVEGELAMARAMYDHLPPSPALRERIRSASGVRLRAHTLLSSELGGGIWGALRVPGDDARFGIFLLDMDGHGVAAALNAFRLHTAVYELAALAGSPADLVSELNDRAVRLLEPGERAGALYAVVDSAAGCLRYAAAAAPPPLPLPRIAGDGSAEGAGPPLAAAAGIRYAEHTVPFPPGTAVVLRSSTAGDAATRLAAALEASLDGPGDRFAAAAEAARTALGETPDDDHTLVWLDRPAAGADNTVEDGAEGGA